MTRDEKMKLLEMAAVEEGWGKTPEGHYPPSLAFRWLSKAYPAIWREFMEWFDEKVREKK